VPDRRLLGLRVAAAARFGACAGDIGQTITEDAAAKDSAVD
jgi:hypothetical protein